MKSDVLVACLICLTLLGAACGKKGEPLPQDQKNLFAWKDEQARFTANGCLAVTASMTGATRNVEGFSLELEPLAPAPDEDLPPELAMLPDSCAGCPFLPRETGEITPQEVVAGKNAVQYAFTYCPRIGAQAYRWRLVARNVFRSFPFVLSPVRTVHRTEARTPAPEEGS